VECVFTLWSTGTFTIDLVQSAKSRNIILPKTLNQAMGKRSNQQTGFNDIAWGDATCSYVLSFYSNINKERLGKIIAHAKEYMKKGHHTEDDQDNQSKPNNVVEDSHAQFIYHSASYSEPENEPQAGNLEDNCKFTFH
jgi:hypothetical protein